MGLSLYPTATLSLLQNGGYTPLDHARANGQRTAAVAAVLRADPRVAAALAAVAAVNTC